MRTDTVPETMLREHLASIGKEKEFLKYYSLLTMPEKISFINEARKDLMRLLLNGKRRKDIALYLRKYSWIRNSYAHPHTLTEKDVLDEIKQIEEEVKDMDGEVRSLKDFSKIRMEKEELMNGLPGDIRLYLDTMAFFTHWQDERKKAIFHSIDIISMFLDEFSRRTGIEKELLERATPREITQGRIDATELKQRETACIILWENEKETVLVGADALRVNEAVYSVRVEDLSEIRGTPASFGVVTGRVRLVIGAKGAELKKGEILVAGMTRPDYAPLLKNAAAIVTNDGGITCHAAIVSRELGIPCVIGTKVATHVLMDGDLVQVDANEGVVRKLKR